LLDLHSFPTRRSSDLEERRWSHRLASPFPHPCEPGFHLLPEGDHSSFRLRYDLVEILLGVHSASSDDLLGLAFPLGRCKFAGARSESTRLNSSHQIIS